jgi:F0F1-type ATP synthase assembly protein I
MADHLPDPKEAGNLFALAMVGLEMVVPIGVGYWLDRTLGWSPWGVTAGVILGLGGGLYHLVVLSNRINREESSKKPGDRQ